MTLYSSRYGEAAPVSFRSTHNDTEAQERELLEALPEDGEGALSALALAAQQQPKGSC